MRNSYPMRMNVLAFCKDNEKVFYKLVDSDCLISEVQVKSTGKKSFAFFLLRYNSYSIVTMCNTVGFGIFTVLCNHHHHIIPEHFHHHRRKPHTSILFFSPPTDNYTSAFCLYRFVCSGHFLEIESYNMWPLVSGFFHLA